MTKTMEKGEEEKEEKILTTTVTLAEHLLYAICCAESLTFYFQLLLNYLSSKYPCRTCSILLKTFYLL